MDEADELDRLAGQLLQGVITPEMLPDVIVSLAAWLQPPVDDLAARPYNCPLNHQGGADSAPCRRLPGRHDLPGGEDPQCAVCAALDSNKPDWQRVVDLFRHCRALREFADHAASWAHTSHVAAIILSQQGRVLDCDYRGESFLKAGHVLRLTGGQLACTELSLQPGFNLALKDTAASGRTANLLLHAPEQPDKRFSLALTRMQLRPPSPGNGGTENAPAILCLVAPLDGRRIATARQLMDLFGLSGAEARLARAICHGDSVEEYARDQGLRLPTVRTQLSAIFNKTGTQRQAALVRLIAGIPVVRDAADLSPVMPSREA